MTETRVTNATCIGCGCVCDDIELHASDDRIVRAERACDLGRARFLSATTDAAFPAALIDGRPAPLDEAVRAAVALLSEADMPLVYGLGNSTCEAQREALHLAELLGGVIDSHTSLTHGPTKIGGQLVGKVTASLGEIRNRADLVIYWGSNPAESHPRHTEKYSLEPRGKFTPNGRKDRTMVLVDVRETPTARQADLFLQVRPGADFEVLTALRAILRDGPVDEALVAASGLTVTQLRALVERMKAARFGVLFFGTGLTATRGRHMNAAAALLLATEMNRFTKFAVMPMRDHGNESGIDYVLSWTSGYPLGIDFSRRFPRSNPGEFTAVDLLVRREVDAALIVGDGQWAMMPQAALDHLARIPTIVLDSRVGELSRLARVHITTSATAVSAAGTVYRMDKVPLPLRVGLRSPYPSEEDVLSRARAAFSALGA